MKKKSTLLVVVLFSCFSLLYAQDNAISNAINKNNIQFENNNALSSNDAKKNMIPFWKGWCVGFSYGATKFRGDVTQYDHYPAYQEVDGFFELKTAMSFNFEKRINSFYSLATELSMGQFSGLRRANEYLGYNVYDPCSDNYEGNGDKFVTSFKEIDVLVNINLTNAMSYFGKSSKRKKIYFNGKLGIGYNVFNSLRTNLFSDTYIHDFGYEIQPGVDFGTQKKSFFNQTTETVYIYGIRVNYKVNPKIELNIDYTLREGLTDKWDASLMSTQYETDNFKFLSVGVSYKIGNHDYNNDWTNPIDVLKDGVSALNIRIEGFTDDADNDGVSDAFDKNSTTPLGVAVDGSGNALDVDMDNVPDYRDADPFSNRGVLVDANGVELDDDKDGVPNSKDLESNTQIGSMVNQFGMNVSNTTSVNNGGLIYFTSIYFNSGSAIVGSSNANRIATTALLLKSNPSIKLKVIGHTDNVGNANFNKKLGLKRANAVINYLVLNYNVAADRLTATTKGEDEPLSAVTQIANNLETGKSVNRLAKINRRVDFEIAN